LIAKLFLKDPTIAEPPKAVPIQPPASFCSAEYTTGELFGQSEIKLIGQIVSAEYSTSGIHPGDNVEHLMSLSGLGNIGDVFGLAGELGEVQVAT